MNPKKQTAIKVITLSIGFPVLSIALLFLGAKIELWLRDYPEASLIIFAWWMNQAIWLAPLSALIGAVIGATWRRHEPKEPDHE